MQCPKCQFENRESINFCEECGVKFELECPSCSSDIPFGRKFCGECGYNLVDALDDSASILESENLQVNFSNIEPSNDISPIAGERKHVTVLFSDLTGYTAMSENLDPEDIKEITSRVFGEAAKIIDKYE